MKTFLWIDTNYVKDDILVCNAESIEKAREILTQKLRIRLAEDLSNYQRDDQTQWRQTIKMIYEGFIMYINKEVPKVLDLNDGDIFSHS